MTKITPAAPTARAAAPRQSGRVQLAAPGRAALVHVKLCDIRCPQQDVQERDSRLDLAVRARTTIHAWTAEGLDVLLLSSAPLLLERGAENDRHYVLLAGGSLLPALRKQFSPETRIPAIVLVGKFGRARLLAIAAARELAPLAALPADVDGLLELARDAERAGASVFNGAPGGWPVALGLGPQTSGR